jgi:hypothetical protein
MAPIFTFSTAADNEEILYMTGFEEGGGIEESFPVVDMNGDLHVFMHIVTADTDRLIHLYYIDGETIFDIIVEDAIGLELRTTYNTDINIGLVYSVFTLLGDLVFYNYNWMPTNIQTREIYSITQHDLLYITYFDVEYANGFLHIFHNKYDDHDMTTLNMTHHFGFLSFWNTETFVITPPSLYQNVVETIVDRNGDLWYLYDYTGPYGIGIGVLNSAMGMMIPVDQQGFTGVSYEVEKVIAVVEDTDLFSFMFLNPSRMFWGTFDGIDIKEYSQAISYTNPSDFNYKVEGDTRFLILSDVQGSTNFVNLYYASLVSETWLFNPIPVSNHVSDGFFSTFIYGENYVLLYNTTVAPTDYSPTIGVQYIEEEAISLFTITSEKLDSSIYIENLTPFNPWVDFFTTQWYVLVIIVVVLALLITLLVIYIRRNREKLSTFLTDTQVGDHSKFVLFFKNVARYIKNVTDTVVTIWTSNKKRTILTLTGFIITGYLLSSAIIIAQSEESAMIKAYYEANSMLTDSNVSARVITSLISNGIDNFTIEDDYANLAKQEILDIYSGMHVQKYVDQVISAYSTSTYVYYQYTETQFYQNSYDFVGLPDDSDRFMQTLIYEGRVPENKNEVIISYRLSQDVSRYEQIQINDTIMVIASNENVGGQAYNYMINATVVGFFSPLNIAQLRKISTYLDLPNDIYSVVDEKEILTKESLFFDFFNKNDTKLGLNIVRGYYQFDYSFDDFRIDERATLVTEQEELEGKVFTFSFDTLSAVTIGVKNSQGVYSSEIKEFFEDFNTYYLNNMARLLIFAIPAILLSIFMVFESSELFSSSYESEINILRNRGIPNKQITSIYLSIRFFEIVIASVISFGIAILTAIPLIKVNGFITFRNQDTNLVIGNVPVELAIVFVFLFVISVPRILMIIRRKRSVEKAPSTFMKIVKAISWRDLFFLLIGIALFWYFYNQAFAAYYESHVENFTIYLYLTIVGAIFTLIGGLPIVIKILSMIWKGIGYTLWKAGKSKTSFLFSEISKDIKYFENITLIFLLIVCILVPVLIVPYSKESTLSQQAYFINGADVKVERWNKITQISEEQIEAMPEVRFATNVKVYTMYSGSYSNTRIVVINTTEFTNIIQKPPQTVSDLAWSKMKQLTSSTVIVSKSVAQIFNKELGEYMSFMALVGNTTLVHRLEILEFFELFPVYYDEEEAADKRTMMIMSYEAFDEIDEIITTRLKTFDDLYIKLYDVNKAEEVKREIFPFTGGQVVKTMEDVKDKLKTPLYNIFIIEMILSLFVASLVLVFSSFTTSIKILERRVVKHDIMKKMGINVPMIINMSAIQTLVAAILPSMIIGTAVGLLAVKPTLIQLSYGTTPYEMYVNYPWLMISMLLVGIPLMIYLFMNLFLKREFGKYAPTIME